MEKSPKNLGNIKSVFTIRLIFSFVEEKVKLNLIHYNKKLQNIIKVDLVYYKRIGGIKIILENNNKGKEIMLGSDVTLYEGEFLNGKRNGQGKLFDEEFGKLIYEGEFLNGKFNGKGKQYILGFLLIDGEFLNGEPKIGKGYYPDGSVSLLFDENGKTKEFYQNGKLKFEGEYKNGIKWNGIGYDIKGNISFEIINGKGIFKFYDGNGKVLIEGDYANGKLNGNGKEYYQDGKVMFEGEYQNGLKKGKGKEYYSIGKLYFEGEYLYDKRWNGKGYDINGKVEFEIKNGKGNVVIYDYEGNVYKGEYLYGEKNGKGKEYNISGHLIFEGEYLNGKRSGKGKEYDELNGKLIFEGEYLNGKKVNNLSCLIN